MRTKLRPLLFDLISLLAGAALPFAFAPYNLSWLAIACPAILLALWQPVSPTRAFVRGLLFGLSFFALSIWWVFISIHVFGNSPSSVAILITGGFVLVLALCIAVNGFVYRWLFRTPHWLSTTVGFAAFWVIVEWLRGWLFTGFPWMYLGYSQINSALAGFAPVVSVYGVSFFVVLSSGLLVSIVYQRKTALYSAILLLAIWLGGWGLTHIHWTKPVGKPISVSLIQGNIPQTLKWDPNQLPQTLTRYYNLTAQNRQQNIIVWPEAALPIWYSQAQAYLQRITKLLQPTHGALLTGVPIVNASQTEIYNGAVVIGNGNGQYLKRHLVPFGEYVPLESALRGLINFFNLPMSNLSDGPAIQAPVVLAGIPTAVSICYEIAYDAEFLQTFPEARLIVTISDDAWFGDSWAAEQQTQISQMRSLETGRYQLVASNNGVTALIGINGQILQVLPRFQTAVLNGQIYDISGNTPVALWGTLPAILILWLLAIGTYLLTRSKRS